MDIFMGKRSQSQVALKLGKVVEPDYTQGEPDERIQ